MARPSSLEAQLNDLTRRFVADILAILRSASFADVAALSFRGGADRPRLPGPRPTPAPVEPRATRRTRQTAEKRSELGARVLQTLSRASAPMGVRALSSALNVAPDLLAAPLKELRAAGQVSKHGEKRNTTYSAA
jgi:hypothetical protein